MPMGANNIKQFWRWREMNGGPRRERNAVCEPYHPSLVKEGDDEGGEGGVR